MRRLVSLLAAAFLAWPAAAAAGTFGDSVGVNVHMGYTGTAYTGGQVDDRLVQLGIVHVRDGLMPGRPDQWAKLRALPADVSMIVGREWQGQVPQALSTLRASVASTTILEGVNESDLWDGCCSFSQSEKDATTAHQAELHAQGAAEWQVAAPSVAFGTCPGCWAATSEASNRHPYAKPGWETPAHAVDQFNQALAFTSGVRPVYATEYGWRSGPTPSADVVTEAQHRDRMISGVLELLRTGYERVYLYELMDQSDRWGLVRSDGVTLKAAGVALGWWMARLGPASRAGAPRVSVSGAGVRSSAWDLPDGRQLVALWRTADGSSTAELWDVGQNSTWMYSASRSTAFLKSATARNFAVGVGAEPVLVTVAAP